MGVQIHDDERGHWFQVNSKKLTGNKRPKTFFGHGSAAKKACADAAALIKQKIGEGKFSIKKDAERKTLKEAGDALFTPNGHRRDSTLRSYAFALEHVYPTLGHKQVGDITVGDIEALLAGWRKDAKGTIALRLNVLATLLNHCARKGIIQRSPIGDLERAFKRGLRKRDTVGRVRALSRSSLMTTLDALAAHNPTRQFTVFWLLLCRTGLRIGEAMGLQWDDVDLEARRILVQRAVYEGKSGPTKTGESRYVDLSEELALALDALRDEQTDKSGAEWIFSSPRFPEKPASYLFWLKHLTAATKKLKLGMKVTPHLFRHTYASQLLQAGVQITYVAAQLGHARVSMTLDIYSHFLPTDDSSPVNLLDGGAAHPRRSFASVSAISDHANHSRHNKLTA
jgi:integrase